MNSANPPSQNRRIRVFVSSTFRDMMEERDELMTHAWPELRRFCRERQVEMVEVDLRWGIAEEQTTRRETLKLCLDEIRACRPFFLGLLGERYGWVPGDDAFTTDLEEEQQWLKDLHGKSVTELEILHGVLNNPEMAGRAFFYFRDPKYVESVHPDRRSDFDAENPASAEKQQRLKALIRAACAAKNIPLCENYADPIRLASLVLEDLKTAVDAQFPLATIPDPFAREARDHDAFAEIRRRTYIGRSDYFTALDRHAQGDRSPLVVLGDAGSGKSALLANWIDRWRKAHPEDFVFEHYIGSTPDSAQHWWLMARLVAEIKRWSGDPDEPPKSHDELLRDFPLWLAKARIKAERDGVRFIVLLDALNQLEDDDHARALGWLPSHPFTGPLRLIASILPGDTHNALEKRQWASLRVEPLTADERLRMIADYLMRFGKKLDGPRLERLSAAPAAANPLYLKTLLDELRVSGTHDRLDERLNDYLAAPDVPALLRKVLTRYQRDYERDRPGLVSDALGLMWASRRGLAETELLRLLRPVNQPQLPPALWNPLRAALEESLVDRSGILNFAHDFLRSAVESMFVVGQEKRDDLRMRLADDFEKQPVTARTCDELPWLLWQAKQRTRLRSCLLDIDRFLEIRNRDQEELRGYWVWLGQERTMGKPYADSFDAWASAPGRPDPDVALAANRLVVFLEFASIYEHAEPLLRRALAISERIYGSSHANVASDLNNLAWLLKETNRLSEAEPLMRRALVIDEQSLGAQHPHVARDLSNLALLLHATNRLREAEPLMQRALAISEHNFGTNHPDVFRDLNNLAGLMYGANRVGDAEPLLRKAIVASEKTFGTKHPNVAVALSNLVVLLHSTNRMTEAESVIRRALAIDESCLGANHPLVAVRLNNLSAILKATNRLKEAEPLLRRALDISEHTLGPDHPDVALRLNNLSDLYTDIGRLGDAEPLLRRSLEIFLKFSRASGHRHPNLQVAIDNYADLLRQMGMKPDQIKEKLDALLRPYGISIGAAPRDEEGQKELERKLLALVKELQSNPQKANDIALRVRDKDPELFQALMELMRRQKG
jgi:nephrocystin-3